MNQQQRPSQQLRTMRTAVAAAVLAGAGFVSFGALAANHSRLSADERAQIEQTYQAERAACLDGSSAQAKQTCLTEANAARAAARAGQLTSVAEPEYQANALQRCDAVPTDARDDCVRRVNGEGTVVGSVAEGVIIRELPSQQAEQVATTESVSSTDSDPAAPAPDSVASIDMATDSRSSSSSQGGMAAGGEGMNDGASDALNDSANQSSSSEAMPVAEVSSAGQAPVAVEPAPAAEAPPIRNDNSGLTESQLSQAGPDLYNELNRGYSAQPTQAPAVEPTPVVEAAPAQPEVTVMSDDEMLLMTQPLVEPPLQPGTAEEVRTEPRATSD